MLGVDVPFFGRGEPFDGPARRWEPKRLRLRVFRRRWAAAGRLRLRLARHWPWARYLTAAVSRLLALAPS